MSSPIPLRDYSRMSGDDALPPPPPASWADYFWWIVVGLLGLIALGTIAAVVLAGVYGSKTLHTLDTWPSPSSAPTAQPTPTSAATRPPTPTSAATRYPSFSSFPTPSPVCTCCTQCASSEAYQCTCCQYCPSCNGQVSAAVDVTTLNVVGMLESGVSIPPDTIMAVGNNDDGGRIVTAVNRAVVILNKATHELLSIDRFFYSNFRDGGDPWVTWDPLSHRFFITAFSVIRCGQLLTVDSPPAIAGQKCAGIARFGPSSYIVSGAVEVASPLLACGPVASLAGKIALIQRGTCNFAVKVKNAQNAGAIGVIVYNNVDDSTIAMGGVDPSIVIPSVFVGKSDGLAITANLPVSVTISAPAMTSFSTVLFISVSNTSAPNDRNDFYHYSVSDGNYSALFADFPKHSTDNDALYISTQMFGDESADGVLPCIGPNIRAFDKRAMLDGIGALTLWDTTIPTGGLSGPIFVAPAQLQPPIADETMPTLFIGPNTGNGFGFCGASATPPTGFRIYSATAAGGVSSFIADVPFPTPITLGACLDASCNDFEPNLRQPPPAIPYKIESSIGVLAFASVYKNKLYVTYDHNVSSVQTAVRWFVIDVAPIATFGQPVLLQWGDINVSPDIDTSWSRIAVNDDETFVVTFYQSGPAQHIVPAYTFHLAADPPNSIRLPLHTAIPNEYVYFEDVGTGRNRYGDYTGLALDPVDRSTFYSFVQRPDPIGFFDPPGQFGPCLNTSLCVARVWTTDLYTFRIDTNTCPTDGIATTPTVLSSDALPGGMPSVPAASPLGFETPEWRMPEDGGEEGMAEADA